MRATSHAHTLLILAVLLLILASFISILRISYDITRLNARREIPPERLDVATATRKTHRGNASALLFTPPGLIAGGTLFLGGARITTSYDDDPPPVIHVFFVARAMLSKKCRVEGRRPQANSSGYFGGMLGLKEMIAADFTCSVGDGDHPRKMMMIFQRSYDLNTMDQSHIYECAVRDLFPNRDALYSYQGEALRLEIALAGEIVAVLRLPMMRNKRRNSLFIGGLGVFGIEDPFDSLSHRDHDLPLDIVPDDAPTAAKNLTLCLGGVGVNGLGYLYEWLHHHFLVGANHVVIGFLASSSEAREEEMRRLVRVLRPFLEARQVSVGAIDIEGLSCRRDSLMVHFYHTCLYHAKGVSRFVGTWDLDEFWMPGASLLERDKEIRPPALAFSLTDALVAGDLDSTTPCGAEWCYVMFASHEATDEDADDDDDAKTKTKRRVSIIGTEMDRLHLDILPGWEKSIAQTKNVLINGYHYPGSCVVTRPLSAATPNVRVGTVHNNPYGRMPYSTSSWYPPPHFASISQNRFFVPPNRLGKSSSKNRMEVEIRRVSPDHAIPNQCAMKRFDLGYMIHFLTLFRRYMTNRSRTAEERGSWVLSPYSKYLAAETGGKADAGYFVFRGAGKDGTRVVFEVSMSEIERQFNAT